MDICNSASTEEMVAEPRRIIAMTYESRIHILGQVDMLRKLGHLLDPIDPSPRSRTVFLGNTPIYYGKAG